jgi:hypothetical protein
MMNNIQNNFKIVLLGVLEAAVRMEAGTLFGSACRLFHLGSDKQARDRGEIYESDAQHLPGLQRAIDGNPIAL